MLLDNKKKKLFDEAYNAYLGITKVIEGLFNEAMSDPFAEDRPSVTDVVCDLDMYLQGLLLKIAVADGSLPEEEIEFIMSLPDELDEVCSRHRGYRRFLKSLSVESYHQNAGNFFADDTNPAFLQMVREEDESAADSIVGFIETILNAFAAIDDSTADCENAIITKTLSALGAKKKANSSGNSVSPAPSRSQTAPASSSLNNSELDDILQELDSLVGLSSVKQEVLSSINLLKINNMRKEKGLPELQTSCHMVFTGQPGTGKTTVARIMAKIYKSLGVVSKGHLVETDRSGMVAGYVGQTALKTAQVIKKAKGGVLFVDEAYSLTSEDGSNDYGKEAIDTLVKGMEDYRDDLVVIVAGYTDEMTKFINMNSGLRSRFNKYISFENYSADEMLDIFKGLCEKAQFIVSPQAAEKAHQYFMRQQGNVQFGNARGVRNYFDRIVTAQATRILSLGNPSEEEFRTIIPADLDV